MSAAARGGSAGGLAGAAEKREGERGGDDETLDHASWSGWELGSAAANASSFMQAW